MDISGKFQNLVVTSRPVQMPRSHSIVIDSSGTIEPFPHSAPSSAPHNRAIIQTGGVVACLLLSLC